MHTLAAAFGLSAILATSAHAFAVVKIAGAVYLGYLGAQMLFAKPDRHDVALFFLAFLPQFVAPQAASRMLSLLFPGALFVGLGVRLAVSK